MIIVQSLRTEILHTILHPRNSCDKIQLNRLANAPSADRAIPHLLSTSQTANHMSTINKDGIRLLLPADFAAPLLLLRHSPIRDPFTILLAHLPIALVSIPGFQLNTRALALLQSIHPLSLVSIPVRKGHLPVAVTLTHHKGARVHVRVVVDFLALAVGHVVAEGAGEVL